MTPNNHHHLNSCSYFTLCLLFTVTIVLVSSSSSTAATAGTAGTVGTAGGTGGTAGGAGGTSRETVASSSSSGVVAGGGVTSTWQAGVVAGGGGTGASGAGGGTGGTGGNWRNAAGHRTIGDVLRQDGAESPSSTSSTSSTFQQHHNKQGRREKEHKGGGGGRGERGEQKERTREKMRNKEKVYSNSSNLSSASTTSSTTSLLSSSSSSSSTGEGPAGPAGSGGGGSMTSTDVHLLLHQHHQTETKESHLDEYDNEDDDEDEEEEDKEDMEEMEETDKRHGSKSRAKNHKDTRKNTYSRSNCSRGSRCQMMAETIKLTKEAIKQQILRKLGLSQAPNITGRPVPQIPPLNHLLDHYGMQADAPGSHFKAGPVFEDAVDDYHAKTRKVITFAQPPPPAWNISATSEVQYFKFSEGVMKNKVLEAHLWLYLSPSKVADEGQESTGPYMSPLLHVYKVIRSDHSPPVHSHVYSTKVEAKSHGGSWITLDARKLVTEWFRNPLANFGIVVQAFDKDGHQLIVTNTNAADNNSTLFPFMEVVMTDESKRRTRRMTGLNCEENTKEVRCCRYPLTVDFEEFGWDWIIAPKKYEANYCSGECPFVYLQKYPHTHLVQQANPSGSAGPCCAPRRMSPISMLYFDQELNIIYGLLPGMVVDRCGCS